MHIHFKTSLCRKCPHDVVKVCAYKQVIRETLSGILPGMHFSHKCSLYHNLFKPGQVVTLDLYSQLREDSGEWKWVLAYKNVSGIIMGTHFEFYVVELHKMVLLSRRCDKDTDAEIIKPFFTYKKAAKGLRLIPKITEINPKQAFRAFNNIEMCRN
jgi:hypothetical protein